MSIIGRILRFFLERSARSATYPELTQALSQSQAEVAQRMQKAQDTSRNRNQACHIIGIERWGQRRLKVALGEPFVQEEYDGYCPEASLGVAALAQNFMKTRAETVALTRSLEEQNVPLSKTIFHNDAGDLTVRAWLRYLDGHAARESKRL